MLLEYEWGNPAAAAAAMLLFGEEPADHDTCHQDRQSFEHFGGGGTHLLPADFFGQQVAPPPPPPPAVAMTSAGLFPTSTPASCHQRYNVGLPVAPTRIGLNLGVRTYFSSAAADQGTVAGGRTCRRRTRVAKCQAEGCGADLAHAKHYHRRHKVCEYHSKASIVITAGQSQRFCQQCSRFHVLSEFDHGKRSCRKRLADHNRRRRKSQDITNISATTNLQLQGEISNIETPPNKEKVLFSTAASNSSTNNNHSIIAHLDPIGCNKEPTLSSTPPPPPNPMQPAQMALGLGCYAEDGGVVVVPASTGLSASSSTGTSPPRASFLSGIGEFRSDGQRFTPSWDEAEYGCCSIRGLFQ